MNNLLHLMFGRDMGDSLEWGDELFLKDYENADRISFVINHEMLKNAKLIKELSFYDLLSEIKGFTFVKGISPYIQVTLIGGVIKVSNRDQIFKDGLYENLFRYIGKWLVTIASLDDMFGESFDQIEVYRERDQFVQLAFIKKPKTSNDLPHEIGRAYLLDDIADKFIQKINFNLTKKVPSTFLRSGIEVYDR